MSSSACPLSVPKFATSTVVLAKMIQIIEKERSPSNDAMFRCGVCCLQCLDAIYSVNR
jgi:hypothetical protein